MAEFSKIRCMGEAWHTGGDLAAVHGGCLERLLEERQLIQHGSVRCRCQCGRESRCGSERGAGDGQGESGILDRHAQQRVLRRPQGRRGKGAKAQGFDLVQTNANGDAQQQVNDAINLLSQGVTALVLNPIDSKAIIPAVEKANSMNVPVFMLDRGSDGGKVTSFVASDNVALGKTAADWISDQLKARYGSPKGNVVDLIGLVGTTAATDREKGFSDEIAKFPDIKVVARQEGAFDQEKSLNAMTDILQKYPQIDAVFGANDDNTVGAEKAIDNAGRYKPLGDKAHIMVIGADGTAQALSAIRAGKQDATISQNPIEMAAKALQFISDYNNKKDVPANYAWPTLLITKDNIDSDATKKYGLWSEQVSQ